MVVVAQKGGRKKRSEQASERGKKELQVCLVQSKVGACKCKLEWNLVVDYFDLSALSLLRAQRATHTLLAKWRHTHNSHNWATHVERR